MIKKVGYLILTMLFLPATHALVPVEGILMGQAQEDIQQDPLNFIFRDHYDRSQLKENKRLKLYHNTYTSGVYLAESCNYYGTINYTTTWKEKQARRSAVATLQFIGLDTTIKAVGAYARKVEMSEREFNRLSYNLVKNYCSKNMSIMSLRNVEKSLAHYYHNPETELIPSVDESPFATETFKYRTESNEARSVELDYAVRAFRSFCSWGGDVEDYRLLGPYLKNPFIMAFINKNMLGLQDSYLEEQQKISSVKSDSTVQVICEDLICRKTAPNEFAKKFPLSTGSTGLHTDFIKLYCSHFRFQDYHSASSIPQVRKWIKESELEHPVFETSFFISLMTGVPDPVFGTEKYVDLPFIAKSSIDERWNIWARDVLGMFSKNLLFEESLKIKVIPRRNYLALKTEGFRLKFSVALGEMDQIMDDTDKLRARFEFKLSKNYLRSLGVKWNVLLNEVDLEGQRAFKQEIAEYLGLQLKEKEKLFLQKMWNQELARLMAEELLGQVLVYRGPLFNSYSDKVLIVPVEFDYGLFALSYLRFRADEKGERLKFKF